MAEPKIIPDNSIDTSRRWAKAQELLEETAPLIRDAGIASQHAQTEVILPAIQPHIYTLLGISSSHVTWAQFSMPTGFNLQKRRLFTSQLVPLLESDDQQDSLISRIEKVSGEKDEETMWEKEKQTLLALLKLLQILNKDLIDIVSRCKQFQKG